MSIQMIRTDMQILLEEGVILSEAKNLFVHQESRLAMVKILRSLRSLRMTIPLHLRQHRLFRRHAVLIPLAELIVIF